MISMKDYAKNKNISYEAVRKQVARYKEELGDHIIVQGKTQYLDEAAVEFLDSKRAVNAIHIIEHDKDEQIEELERQNKNLQIKIMELQEQLISTKDMLIERDQQLLELKDQILSLTVKPDPEPEEPASEPEKEPDQEEQPVVPPVVEVKKEKKWWQFWK